MSEQLIRRVKQSLSTQFYFMNDSWLSDCIEYYLQDHENSTHDEIIMFVINQWLLCDLREINNENGYLPRNLKNQKCTMLSGKYILQMDKLYDISESKYKQLEKIRNISSENLETTENENKQDDKMQNWEPKSKRMLQLFLTDGIQDIVAIEYKPIRFLKDNLYPGFKLLIKGPVICRKGVILLEETNISEVGGEVDSLLIANAVENVFARALNLEENSDPYNDNKEIQNTKSAERTTQIEYEFDINTDVIDQIDKQVQQQNSISKKPSVTCTDGNQQTQVHHSINNQNLNYGKISQSTTHKTSTNYTSKSKKQICNVQSKKNIFEDDDDLFLDMVDEKLLENLPVSKPVSTIQKSVISNQSSLSQVIKSQNIDDFPMEDEIYDLADNEQIKLPSPSKQKVNSTLSACRISKFSDDNFEMDNFDITEKDLVDYFNKDNKFETKIVKPNKSSHKSSSSKINGNMKQAIDTNIKNKMDSPKEYETKFNTKMNVDPFSNEQIQTKSFQFQKKWKLHITEKMETVHNGTDASQYEKLADITPLEFAGVKRLASKTSPIDDGPQKMRCLQNTPQNKSCNRKITDFLSKPSRSQSQEIDETLTPKSHEKKSTTSSSEDSSLILLSESRVRIIELIRDVLKQSLSGEKIHTVVRGKVVSIVKLNLPKNEKGSYFHLEGTITDDTGNLDVVFSSEVLEEIIGYGPQVFIQKRKQSKSNPAIKDELREDLKKAQETLKILDVLMEIKYKINERAVIIKIMKLLKPERKYLDLKMHLLKDE